MESIGSYLKEIRKRKNISLEEVREKTKLSLNVLRALEEDRFSDYAPAHIKGFLKIYCRFLGIEPSELISEYEKSFILKKEKITPERINLPRRFKFPLPLRIERIILPILILFILTLSFIFGSHILRRKFHSKKSIPLKEEVGLKKEWKSLRLGLRAKEDCWIRICIDGKTIFRGILKKGSQESWEGKEKIELDVGNAGALSLEVNGKILSPLGRKGQVIKNILITKEGVKIGE
jgi:transcriptional regulator with XRE-family HTH domain